MKPFRQKGFSMASWSTFIFKSVWDQMYNLRLYYIDSGSQHHNKMIFEAPSAAESALFEWAASSSPFVFLPA